jgi:hypothetical protein
VVLVPLLPPKVYAHVNIRAGNLHYENKNHGRVFVHETDIDRK